MNRNTNTNRISGLYVDGDVIDRTRRYVPKDNPTTEIVTYTIQDNNDRKFYVDNYAPIAMTLENRYTCPFMLSPIKNITTNLPIFYVSKRNHLPEANISGHGYFPLLSLFIFQFIFCFILILHFHHPLSYLTYRTVCGSNWLLELDEAHGTGFTHAQLQKAGNSLHSQAWELARHDRNKAECNDPLL